MSDRDPQLCLNKALHLIIIKTQSCATSGRARLQPCKEFYYITVCNFPLQVIAIVTDSLTDLDIFKDLQEACTHRKVPVYILLDQSCAPAFLKMCTNVGVRLDDLRVCGWFSKAGCGALHTIPTSDGIKLKYAKRFDMTGQVCTYVSLPFLFFF